MRARQAASRSGAKRGRVGPDKRLTQGHARRRIAELQRALLVDPLTRLANRRYAELRIDARLNELRRYGWGFGLLFFDIDRFRDFNDRHGHAVGDRVLASVARAASRCVRSMDTVCRWGGDEFLALIGHVDQEQLVRVAEKIRVRIAQSAVRVEAAALPVSISVGATLAKSGDTAGRLLARVDRLMYRSKELGGDRVTVGKTAEQLTGETDARSRQSGVTRILLVDDHEVVRRGLTAVLAKEPDLRVVGQASSGGEAVALAARLAPDVVLMDVTMPMMDGVEATRRIRQSEPQVRVIGLSALADASAATRMAAAGASCFVSKAAAPRELLRAIRGLRG